MGSLGSPFKMLCQRVSELLNRMLLLHLGIELFASILNPPFVRLI